MSPRRKMNSKRLQYKKQQKHMMEVINRKRRSEMYEISEISSEGPSTRLVLHELQNVNISQNEHTHHDFGIPRKTRRLETNAQVDGPQSVVLQRSESEPLSHVETSENELIPSKFSKNSEYDTKIEIMQKHQKNDETSHIRRSQKSVHDINVGRRIVCVSKFYKKLQEISNHGPLGCNIDTIDLISEKQDGLNSKFTFLCRMCNLKFYIDNDYADDNYLDINSCAIAGIMSIGGGHSHLVELSAALNLPIISNKKYQSQHDVISRGWEKVALETMNEAAEKERNFAIAEGRVSKSGIPIIDVVADGCYCKRSYKKNYSALSGAAAIIGRRTGEILFIGVRNKYCFVCDRAEKKKLIPKNHKCYKNYSGPSTGMETAIILEGFKQSVEMHNLVYGRLISDGDSSTYNKILQARPYQDEGITVEKIECRNHLLRNFCNKMQNLQTDTRYPVRDRKNITNSKIMTFRLAIKKVISKNKNDECPEVQNLFDDILLTANHAFGNHSSCKQYFCDKRGTQIDQDRAESFFLSSLWQRIGLLTQNIAGHARSLMHDVDSNIVERYHSIVAKMVGGKRINFSLKQSYGTRCNAAAVSFNTSKCVSRVYKTLTKQSPRGKLKMVEELRLKKKALNRKYAKKKRRMMFKKTDENYGEECKKPDMPAEVFEKMKNNFINSLKKSDDDRQKIERSTILQRDSSEWMELRRSLLTASNFGPVVKRRPKTPCANLVKNILYKSNLDHISSIHHGQKNEKTALSQLCLQEQISVEPCGLFIDEELPFLGASPDGICGEDTIIEIKCPITASKLGLSEAINKKKVNFWLKNRKGELNINQNHHWYYQIQGQLHITKRRQCLFAVWFSDRESLKTEMIKKDDFFWEMKMKMKLVSFYMNCLLPEIVDPRFTRNLPIRDLNYYRTGIPPSDEAERQYQLMDKPTYSRTLDFVDC